MDIYLILKAVILGLVEGFTEFLPISSTGHLILVGDLLDFNDDKGKAFEVIIQFGAILAVCWEYRQKLISVVTGITSRRAAWINPNCKSWTLVEPTLCVALDYSDQLN